MEHTIGEFRFVMEKDELQVYKNEALFHEFIHEDVPTTDFKEWCAFYVTNIADQQQIYRENKFANKPVPPSLGEDMGNAVFQAAISFGHDGALKRHLENPHSWAGVCKPLNGLSAVVFAKALYLGYGEADTMKM